MMWTTNLTSHTSTDAVALDDTNDDLWFTFSYTTTTSFRLVFTTTKTSGSTRRVLLGYLLVTENLPVLSTPAHLALDGAAGENDFTVAWDDVTGAQGYSVKLLDATGENELDAASCSSSETTASFSGLTSSTHYIVSVVALGNHTTTDDSAAATLEVTTAASAIAAPTLNVAVTSWTAGVAGTSAVSATLEGDVACTVATVSMSDGSSATVANGTLSWTPPAANAASSVTATFHVTHGNDGWDIPQVFSVAATPAPAAPSITLSNATRRSFDATWTASPGGPVVEYKVRAWTGRATPDDATGGAEEAFTNGAIPSGWETSGTFGSYAQVAAPVKFSSGDTLITPVFGGTITSLSFKIRAYSTSQATEGSFALYGTDGNTGSAFELINEWDKSSLSTSTTEHSFDASMLPANVHQFKFVFSCDKGTVGFGSFSISGTDWPAADFLEGWGGAKVSVGLATAQTISNPVAGTVNYVEVSAVGPTGLSTSTIASIPIPHAPGSVISVK